MPDLQRLAFRLLAPLVGLALLAAAQAQSAQAQPSLTALAPPDSVLLVTVQGGGEVAPELSDDLTNLDWQGALDTVEKLVAAIEPSAAGRSFAEMLELPDLEEAFEELCPALLPAVDDLAESSGSRHFEALFSVEARRLASPPVTLLARFTDPGESGLSTIRTAIADCSIGSLSFADAGLAGAEGEIYQVSSGPAPVHIAVADSGLIVASNDLYSSIVPLLSRAASAGTEAGSGETGSGEASGVQADTTPFARFEELEGYSLGFAVIVDPLLDNFGNLFLPPGDDPMSQRVRNALDTVDSLAFRASLTDDGFFNEWAVAVDPDRPDPELARLLLCESCGVARPYLAPADAVGFSSFPLPLEGLLDYVEGFLADTGAGISLEAELQRELGIDLERDLLDWLGQDAYLVLLENYDTDLSTLLYQPAQALILPVSSTDGAQAAIDRLLAAVQSEDLSSVGFPLAVREAQYQGIEFRRVQASFNLDMAIAVIGDNLVLASPANGIEAIIDTYQGAPSLVGSSSYRNASRAAPAGSVGLSHQDTSGSLAALGSLLRLLSQPVAALLDLALSSDELADLGSSPFPPGDMEFTEPLPSRQLPPNPTELAPGVTDGELSEANSAADGTVSDFYRLTGLPDGATTTVVLESDQFDTMLNLYDGNGNLVTSNDDAPDTTRSEIEFRQEPGRELILEVTSYWGSDTGSYTLSVETGVAGPVVEPPDFVQLLELLELPARLFDVLADNIGNSSGYVLSDDNVIYSRGFTELVAD